MHSGNFEEDPNLEKSLNDRIHFHRNRQILFYGSGYCFEDYINYEMEVETESNFD